MADSPLITLYRPDYASVRLIQCSPPSWMVEIALREKGLDFRVVELSFARGEHKTPEMLARNPRGTIPVLEYGGVCLGQTLAMLEHLDDAHPEPPLLGRDAASRARARDRLHEAGAVKDKGMALLAYLMRTPDAERSSERVAADMGALAGELEHWERHLAAAAPSGFVAGQEMTLADISLYAYLATFSWLGFAAAPESALADFMARMAERPAVRATWPATWTEAARPRPILCARDY